MIIALSIPAYRQTINVQTAYAWAQDAMTAMEFGWKPLLLWTDNTGVARSRNTIVKIAQDAGARLLMMCDSDTFPRIFGPAEALEKEWVAFIKTLEKD